MDAATVANTLTGRGYTLAVEDHRLRVRGAEPPPDDLDRAIAENRNALAARVLLANPPAWLARLFDLWWSGHETPVRLSGPSGAAEVYMVRVSIKNIAAAVAAEIGMDPLEWQRIRPEVEEALGSWEGAA